MQRLGLGFIYYSVVCSHNAGHNPLKGLCWGQIGLSHTIGTDNKTDKGQGKQGNSWEMQRALDNLPSTTANYSLLERAAFTWDILEIKGLRSDIQKSDLTKMHAKSSLLLASHSQQCTRRETLHLCSQLAYCWVLTQLCENIHGQQTTASSSYAFKLQSKQNLKVAILYTFVIYCPECTAMTWAFPIKYSLHTTGGLKLGHWSHTWQVLAASDDRLSCVSHKGVYQETMWESPIASQSLRQGDAATE